MGVGLGLRGGALLSPAQSLAPATLSWSGLIRMTGAATPRHSSPVTVPSDTQLQPTQKRGRTHARASRARLHPHISFPRCFRPPTPGSGVRGRREGDKGRQCRLPDWAAFRRAWEQLPLAPPFPHPPEERVLPVGGNGATLLPGKSGRWPGTTSITRMGC